MNTTFSVMEGIHYLSIQVKSQRHSTNPNRLSPLYQHVPIVIVVVQSSNSNPYLLAVTRCGQCITALPTLEIQLGCGERQRRLSVGLQMADKNPIGHSVKGSNGRDVHMVRPAVERVGQGREGQDEGHAQRSGVPHSNQKGGCLVEFSNKMYLFSALWHPIQFHLLHTSSFCCVSAAKRGKYVEADTASCATDCVYMFGKKCLHLYSTSIQFAFLCV